MITAINTSIKRAIVNQILRRESEKRKKSGPISLENWQCRASKVGELMFDDVSAVSVARQFGTPVHVVHERELLRSHDGFSRAFKTFYPEIRLATSYKTNPVPAVLRSLHQAGTSAEVISHFELWLALRLGVPPDKIILNGPGKTDDVLKLAVRENVGLINIDGTHEIGKIKKYAAEVGKKQRVGVRVTTPVGWSSQFGLSIGNGAALAAFRSIAECPELDPCGLHLHLGTGIQNVAKYSLAIDHVLKFSDVLRKELNIQIGVFDFGGGFGVPTVRTMNDWDLRMMSLGYQAREAFPEYQPKPADYARMLEPCFARIKQRVRSGEDLPTVYFEPGRAITSSCQTLLLSAIGIKPASGSSNGYVILDGGKNITMPLAWEAHQIYVANRMHEPFQGTYDLVGPLCHPGDVVARNLRLPRIREADVFSVMDAGAYFVPNQMNFSNPRPSIVWVRDGKVQLIRRRERFEDIVQYDDLLTP